MDQNTLETILSKIPENQRAQARLAIPYIAEALAQEGILTPNVLAYAVATAGHESSFVPKEEVMASRGVDARNNYIADLQDNYQGGKQYRGRGYIQLTHKGNYEKYGQRIGEDLVKNPDRVLDPTVSAKVLAAYFKDNGIAELAEQGDLQRARVRVQGEGALNREFIGATNAIAGQAKQIAQILPPKENLHQTFVTQMVNPTVMPEKSRSIQQQQIEQKQVLPTGLNNPNNPFQAPKSGLLTPTAAALTSPANESLKKFFSTQQLDQPKQEQQNQEQVKLLKQQELQQKQQANVIMPANRFGTAQTQTFSASPNAPGGNSLMASAPTRSASPITSYTVKRGDTPSGIAQKLLGNANAWKQVWTGDPRKMPAGITIKVPTPGRARRV